MKEYLQKLGVLCLAITFFASGTVIAILQLFICLTVKPFNVTLFRTLNYYLCQAFYIQLVFLVEWWSGTKIILYTDKNDYEKCFGKEHALCISNHTYEIDWIIIPIIAEPLKLLGHCRCFAKKAIRFAPGLGWVMHFSENVFLERNFEKDKINIERQVNTLSNYTNPMWLIMYPEGTRFTPAKHKASIKFSTEKNLPQLAHHLQPRTRGFIATIRPMRGKVPAIYDFLIALKTDDPNEYQPTFRNILNGNPLICHVYINRIPMEFVPDNEEGQEEFIRNLYIKKDKMKESFLKTGDFFETSGVTRVKPFDNKKRLYPALGQAFWFISILCPIIYFLIKNLVSGELIYSCISIGILSIFYILLNKAIGMSEIKKSSTYGTKTQ